uniref:gamma-glutamyltransferase n=1 Tax=Peribacillus frigoritolerans TaxID=450367 RepID=UPI002023DF49
VVEPTSNGIGGDAFALVWTKGKLHGLNSSGPAPANISIEKIKEAGYESKPMHGKLRVAFRNSPTGFFQTTIRSF